MYFLISRDVVAEVHVGVLRPLRVVEHVVVGVIGQHVALGHDADQKVGRRGRLLYGVGLGRDLKKVLVLRNKEALPYCEGLSRPWQALSLAKSSYRAT